MKSSRIGADCPDFYDEWSRFEAAQGNEAKAHDILQKGRDRGVLGDEQLRLSRSRRSEARSSSGSDTAAPKSDTKWLELAADGVEWSFHA